MAGCGNNSPLVPDSSEDEEDESKTLGQNASSWFGGTTATAAGGTSATRTRLAREHVRPGTTVIDIGCGRDFPAAAWLSGLGAEVHGLDLEGPASSAPPGVQVRAGSVYEMPYGDATFDMAICSHVLEHLQHPRKAMAEIGRVLKPGGRFIFLTPSAWD